MQYEIVLGIKINVMDLIEFIIKRTFCCRTRNQPRKCVTLLNVIKLYPVINVLKITKRLSLSNSVQTEVFIRLKRRRKTTSILWTVL